MNDTLDIRSRACLALNFLNDHPALNQMGGSSYMSECAFWMIRKCKRNLDDREFIIVNPGDPRFDEFKSKVDPGDDYACVSYEDFHGEPWKLDHVEYGLATTFVLYEKEIPPPKQRKIVDWGRYEGFHKFGVSFEDVIIATAIEVAQIFGPFNDDSFLTEEERKSHDLNSAFTYSELQDDPESVELHENPSYLWIPPEVINRRWLKWFVKTDWCKQNWKDQFSILASQEPKEVEPVAVKLEFK